MDPLRSEKRTVTRLRSPSRAALEVRISSGRCLGVSISGVAKRDPVLAREATGSPRAVSASALVAPRLTVRRRSAAKAHPICRPGPELARCALHVGLAPS
jgi:hypothetical protein